MGNQYLIILTVLLFAATYLPVLSGLDVVVGVGLSSLILLASTSLWLKALRGGGGGLGLWVVLVVFSLFMVVRIVEAVVFRDQLLYMVEKAWGFMLLVLLINYYNASGRGYGFFFKPVLRGLVDYVFVFLVLGVSLWALLVSLRAFLGLPSLFSLPLVYGFLFIFVLVEYLVVNSLFEELLFRGIMYSVFSSTLGLIIGGFLLQSLLFGLWHIPHHILYFSLRGCLFHVGFATVFGLVASVYRMFQESLTMPVVIHTIVNFLGFASASPAYPLIVIDGLVLGVQELYIVSIIVLTVVYVITRKMVYRGN